MATTLTKRDLQHLSWWLTDELDGRDQSERTESMVASSLLALCSQIVLSVGCGLISSFLYERLKQARDKAERTAIEDELVQQPLPAEPAVRRQTIIDDAATELEAQGVNPESARRLAATVYERLSGRSDTDPQSADNADNENIEPRRNAE